MSNLKEIFVITDKCTGCLTCKIACALEHSQSKQLFTAIQETQKPVSRLYVEWVPGNSKVPILCRHCEDAPCINACISGAITRSNLNSVITDVGKCIGCWTCVMVCPYGVIGRDQALAKAYRCDKCPDREIPACVSACPTQALVYETVDSFSKTRRKTASRELLTREGA